MYDEMGEVYALDWDIQPEGRAWRGGEALPRLDRAPEKFEMIDGKLFWSDGERLAVLGLLLENLGMKAALRLAPLERWRVALDEVERGA